MSLQNAHIYVAIGHFSQFTLKSWPILPFACDSLHRNISRQATLLLLLRLLQNIIIIIIAIIFLGTHIHTYTYLSIRTCIRTHTIARTQTYECNDGKHFFSFFAYATALAIFLLFTQMEVQWLLFQTIFHSTKSHYWVDISYCRIVDRSVPLSDDRLSTLLMCIILGHQKRTRWPLSYIYIIIIRYE